MVNDGPNPSFDYYLSPRLRGAGPDVIMADLRKAARLTDSALSDALLVFCRYSSSAWLDKAQRTRPAVCALFLDDDYEALVEDGATPARFRRRLRRHGLSQWPQLSGLLDRLWVSTPVLAGRFADCCPVVLGPLADEADLRLREPGDARPPRFGFHATAVHVGEHGWLAPIAAQVLQAVPGLRFEVVASKAAARHWRGTPGVEVVAQRPWPEYRDAVGRGPPVDLMLAPLLPGRANAARAPVKRIDAARAGAGLIVSDAALYGVTAEEARLGMCLPLDPQLWVAALIALAGDPTRCLRLAGENRLVLRNAWTAQVPLFRPAGRPGWWLMG